ncbi:MAG: methyltransferase domain-containing protein [Propylenella sp.]
MIESRNAFVKIYDAQILDPAARELYEGTGLFNFGLWSDGPSGAPRGAGEAARRLVELHLSADTSEEASRASVVLDVGCGLGATTEMIARHYAPACVVGLNLSPVQAAYAAAKTSAALFAVMDGARLAVASGTADRVHCVEAAFHFNTREAFLAEAFRVLRPGGKVVLTDVRYRRGYREIIPEANVFSDEAEYRTRCLNAGFQVDRLEDITEKTLVPFYAFMESRGHGDVTARLKRAQDTYHFAVLRKE